MAVAPAVADPASTVRREQKGIQCGRCRRLRLRSPAGRKQQSQDRTIAGSWLRTYMQHDAFKVNAPSCIWALVHAPARMRASGPACGHVHGCMRGCLCGRMRGFMRRSMHGSKAAREHG